MILVTGATGNVGTHLVPQLVEAGAQVRVLGRDEKRLAALGNQVEPFVGDLERPETLSAALHGVERLFFVTPVTHQVKTLLAAARSAGVRTVVKLSTIEADRSLGPGKWHREQEKLIEASGMAWTFLRPTLMMGNTIEWWAETILKQEAVFFPGGKGRTAPVDPRDVAAAACAVLTQEGHAGKVYELTGPEALTIPEMVQTLSRVLGKPIRYVDVPAFAAGFWMLRSGLPFYVVKGLMETLGALRRSEYAYVTDCVEQVTQQRPTTFEMWCRDHIAAFQ